MGVSEGFFERDAYRGAGGHGGDGVAADEDDFVGEGVAALEHDALEGDIAGRRFDERFLGEVYEEFHAAKERHAVKSGFRAAPQGGFSHGDEGLGADAEVAAVLAFEFVKGSVVEDFGGVGGGVRGFAFDVIADDVWHAGDSEPGWGPAVPAEEEVLGAFALVAGEVGVGEGALAEEGAAEAAPV